MAAGGPTSSPVRASHGPDDDMSKVERIIRHNPLRRGWSIRIGRVRLFGLPFYWDALRARLADASAAQSPPPPPPAHHDHYCEVCDRPWVHQGRTCAIGWAVPCAAHRNGKTAGYRLGHWLIVVRRDRPELCARLGEGFQAAEHVTVVLDRRQSERRVRHALNAPVAAERRLWSDRRAPQTAEDRSIWSSLGFQAHPNTSPDPT
jgi:hypothetical protein